MDTPKLMSDNKLAPFNPTADEAIATALDLAEVASDDVVYDIGCGDGRTLVAAAARAARCVGIEYDPVFSARAEAKAAAAGLSDRITIITGDALVVTDLSEATVVFVYLVPDGLRKMLPLLTEALDRGVRIVSNIFSLPDIEYTEKRLAKGLPVYLYRR